MVSLISMVIVRLALAATPACRWRFLSITVAWPPAWLPAAMAAPKRLSAAAAKQAVEGGSRELLLDDLQLNTKEEISAHHADVGLRTLTSVGVAGLRTRGMDWPPSALNRAGSAMVVSWANPAL